MRATWAISAGTSASTTGSWRQRRSFSLGTAVVCAGARESELARHLKEMIFLSAHRSSYPICPSTQSVSPMCRNGVPRLTIAAFHGKRPNSVFNGASIPVPNSQEMGPKRLCHVARIRNCATCQRDEFSLCTSKSESDILSHAVQSRRRRVVDYMGDDSSVVQAARVSYGRGTKTARDDRALIRYLMRHRHTTPFEMCEIKLHVKLPIFVARQWIRHRTANINEYSGRYSILDKEFYIPEPTHLAAQSTANRQGRGSVLSADEAEHVLRLLREDSERNLEESGGPIDPERHGLTRELARIGLGVNTYTQWYWKTDLHNLLHFLRLRADSHAQYEIRAYADLLLDVVRRWVPMTYDAFVEYQLNSVTLPATAVELLRRMLHGEKIGMESSGLSKREWDELSITFGLKTAAP
jgi:thymidylate synthase (FAD)